ncbi:hypothetical protein H4S06_004041, partial [Coemansia sp. BCRC 34490]
MQSQVPQYILERGDSAREYRRRSSVNSRTSSLSTSSSCLNPSPAVYGDSYSGIPLPQNVVLTQMSPDNAIRSECSADNAASIYRDNNIAAYRMDAPLPFMFTGQNGESKDGNQRVFSQATTLDDDKVSDASMGDDSKAYSRGFGLARPRL